jgi:hypothetical protein
MVDTPDEPMNAPPLTGAVHPRDFTLTQVSAYQRHTSPRLTLPRRLRGRSHNPDQPERQRRKTDPAAEPPLPDQPDCQQEAQQQQELPPPPILAVDKQQTG